MSTALLLSLLIHALLLSLSLGDGLGLPGLDFPWTEKRFRADDLRVRLAPRVTPAPVQAPQTDPVASALGERALDAGPTADSIANPMERTTSVSDLAAPASAAPSQAGRPDEGTPALASGQAPTPPPATVMTSLVPSAASIFAVPSTSSLRLPDIAPEQSSPEAEMPTPVDVVAHERLEQVARERASELARIESAKAEAALESRRQAVLTETAREVERKEAERKETARLEEAQQERARQEEQAQRERAQRAQQEITRLEAARLAAAQIETARLASMRLELQRVEAERQEAAKKEAARQDAAKQEAIRIEAARLAAAQLESARQSAARQELERAEAARVEAERQEAVRQEAARQEAARLERARQEQLRQEQLRQEQAQREKVQEAARLEAARQAAQLEAARQAAAKQELERAEVARAQAERQEAARLEAARQETARQERARQEQARQEQQQREKAQQDAARLEASRQATAQEAARQEAARQENAKQQVALSEEAAREARLRAIGRQLDEEAAKRDADSRTAGLSPKLLPVSSGLRRARLFGRTDPNGELVLYAEAWMRKIQMNTSTDTVRELAKLRHTQPLVTVAIRSDGSIEKVTFVTSSGVSAIDEAVRQIVQNQAPYPTFSSALARDYDVIEIRRSWIFDTAIRLE